MLIALLLVSGKLLLLGLYADYSALTEGVNRFTSRLWRAIAFGFVRRLLRPNRRR